MNTSLEALRAESLAHFHAPFMHNENEADSQKLAIISCCLAGNKEVPAKLLQKLGITQVPALIYKLRNKYRLNIRQRNKAGAGVVYYLSLGGAIK